MKIITNKWFEDAIDTSEEWIVSRTGIRERRFAEADELTSDLVVQAIKQLVAGNAGIDLIGVDFIMVATTTADQLMPNTASQVQNKLQVPNAGCLDLMAACAGFVYGIILAKGLIAAGSHKKVLVIGAETLSKITDYNDRASCILFGDGAGAVLVEPSVDVHILKSITGTDGSHGKDLYLSTQPRQINGEIIIPDGKIHQNGRAVFKWAVQNMSLKVMNY
ncbi:hypothetical protein [Mucilaginibacter sp.]|uniref:thiolase family protein n=1 Tax=Mucilaginibacter sp. TaxID=1882438 RepID=UPI003264C31C